MITKTYGIDYDENGLLERPNNKTLGHQALTLSGLDVADTNKETEGIHTKQHSSGWTITAELHEDWFVWINEFSATHPVFGIVFGDYESSIEADSEEGFLDFYKNHPPEYWDYWDI